MGKPVFAWKVDGEGSADNKFLVRTVKFGDGYEQRQPQSLRPALREWSVSKTDYKDAVAEIAAFLDARRGTESFIWPSPFGDLTVKVAQYELRHIGGDVWKLSWKFEEVLA